MKGRIGKAVSCDSGRGKGTSLSLMIEPKDEARGDSFLKQQLWVRKTMALIVTHGMTLEVLTPLGLPSFSRDTGDMNTLLNIYYVEMLGLHSGKIGC